MLFRYIIRQRLECEREKNIHLPMVAADQPTKLVEAGVRV